MLRFRSGSRGRAAAMAAIAIAAGLLGALAASAGATTLPNGRAYELVSPPDKNGGNVLVNSTRTRVATDGSAAMFASLTGFGDIAGMGVSGEYLSRRSTNPAPGDSGWTTHGLTPPQDALTFPGVIASAEPRYEGEMSDDLSTGTFRAWTSLTGDPMVADANNLYLRDDLLRPGSGTYELVSPCPVCVSPLPVVARFVRPLVAGTSRDFRRVLFESPLDLAPGGSGATSKLYEWVDGALRLAGVLPDGTAPDMAIAGHGARSTYTTHVITADGSRVFFTVPPDGNAQSGLLYARIAGRVTVQLNASERTAPDSAQPATYWDASTDGSRVFFTSSEALTDDAPVDGGGKVYMWALQPTDETQAVTVSATGGTFTLALGGATTPPVAFDAGAAALQAALEALPSVGTGNVAVTGGPGDGGGTTPYQVTFRGDLAGTHVGLMAADGSSLTGGAGTASVAMGHEVRNLTYLSVDNEPADGGDDAQGVIGSSDDGRYVYFVARGQLVAGRPALGGDAGLFLWHDGDIAYVGASTHFSVDSHQLLDGESYGIFLKQSRVTPDGHHLLFNATFGTGLLSAHGRADYDHGSCPSDGYLGPCQELYVYSADTDELACATCVPDGTPATASADARTNVQSGGTGPTSHLNRPLSDDGRYVFFSTREALVPEDVNNRYDAYEYDVAAGRPYLLSSGTSTSNSYFMEVSANGDDAFFVTREQLVGWDRDQVYDLYDARVGGGFPEPPASGSTCVGDACQSSPSAPPSVGEAVTGAFRGGGNARETLRDRHATPRKRCARGKVTRRVHGKVRCVRRRGHHRNRHRGLQADTTRRAK